MTENQSNDRYELMSGGDIVPSSTNPRRDWTSPAAVEALKDLSASIQEKGIVEPIIVRPAPGKGKAGKFEIVCGERRYRAGAAVGLPAFPVIVRQYSDEQVLEVQLIENIQREGLAPLDRARGFQALMKANPDKHSAEKMAVRLGKSSNWIWDQLTLLKLIPEAQRILELDRMTIGHAIPLARLRPSDQKRAIDPEDGGLWLREEAYIPELEGQKKPGPYDGLKLRSIREFTSWIARHVRFDLEHAAAAAPLEFGQAAELVEARVEAAPKRARVVVPITFDQACPPDARDAKGEKTYGASAWRRADGQEKSKRCNFAVLGTVVAGAEGYGSTFEVCLEKEKCLIHWGTEIRAKRKAEKLRAAGRVKQATKRERDEAERQKRTAEREAAAAAAWERLRPQLNAATRRAFQELGEKLTPKIFAYVLKEYRLPKTTKPAGLAYALLGAIVERVCTPFGYVGHQGSRWAFAEILGVDIKALRAADAKRQAEESRKQKGKSAAA